MSILPKNNISEADGLFKPQLTSLIDVLTILLVFLIKSFSVEGSFVTTAENLVLPFSTSDVLPKNQSGIEITKEAIFANGKVVVAIDSIDLDSSLLIEPLYKVMSLQDTKYRDTLKGREIMIQCDRDLKYLYLKRVMYSCSKAGFNQFSVLVIQEEK